MTATSRTAPRGDATLHGLLQSGGIAVDVRRSVHRIDYIGWRAIFFLALLVAVPLVMLASQAGNEAIRRQQQSVQQPMCAEWTHVDPNAQPGDIHGVSQYVSVPCSEVTP
jgi:hypothetical protein